MTEYQLKIIFVLVLCAPVVYFGFRFFVSLLRNSRPDSSSTNSGGKDDANGQRGQESVRKAASQGAEAMNAETREQASPAQLRKKAPPKPPRPARTRRPYRNRNRGL